MITSINEFKQIFKINEKFENKTIFVIVQYLNNDFEALCYIDPNDKNNVYVLSSDHNSIMKDSNSYNINVMKNIKLASQQDFDKYRVQMEQYNKSEFFLNKPKCFYSLFLDTSIIYSRLPYERLNSVLYSLKTELNEDLEDYIILQNETKETITANEIFWNNMIVKPFDNIQSLKTKIQQIELNESKDDFIFDREIKKPDNVIENGEYIEPNTFNNDSEAVLFYSYLEALKYINYLEKLADYTSNQHI